MKYSREYNKPSVSGAGCNYANLQSYNQNYFGRGHVTTPQISSSRSAEIVVVPSYGGVGNNALTTNLANGKTPSCNSFYTLNSAYPSYPGTCGAFSSNLCS